jgi:hypothetical protein
LKGRISEHRKSLKDKERKDGKSLNEGEEKMWREWNEGKGKIVRVGIKGIRRWGEVLKMGRKDMESFQRKGGKDEEIVKGGKGICSG